MAQISDVKFDASSGNEFETPESGNVFVTMDVTFVNKASDSKNASPFDFKLKSAGVEHELEFMGPCETWSPVDVDGGASYGPKCLAFQASAKQSTGLVLVWQPGLIKTYNIPLG
jgi:hypothetical protein